MGSDRSISFPGFPDLTQAVLPTEGSYFRKSAQGGRIPFIGIGGATRNLYPIAADSDPGKGGCRSPIRRRLTRVNRDVGAELAALDHALERVGDLALLLVEGVEDLPQLVPPPVDLVAEE